MHPLLLIVSLGATGALAVAFGWITADLAVRSGRNRWRWFAYGTALGPLGLFLILYRSQRPVCRSCGKPVRPLVGLCPHCLTELDPPQRVSIRPLPRRRKR